MWSAAKTEEWSAVATTPTWPILKVQNQEAPQSDPAVDPSDGNLTTVAQTLRNEVNSCLSREAWHEVASFQHALMHLLDTTNQSQQPMPKETRRNLFLLLGNQLQDITERQSDPTLYGRYLEYTGQLREMAFMWCLWNGGDSPPQCHLVFMFSCLGMRASQWP